MAQQLLSAHRLRDRRKRTHRTAEYSAVSLLFFMAAFGHEVPTVKLNHLSSVLDSDDLKAILIKFFKQLGFKRLNENEFMLPDDFRFVFKDRPSGDLKTIASIEFETSKNIAKEETVRISDHVFIKREGHQAQLIFE